MSENNPEQFSLDFTQPKSDSDAHDTAHLQRLKTDELEALFQQTVGVNPQLRFLEEPDAKRRMTLIDGIRDPIRMKEKIRLHDTEEDQRDRNPRTRPAH